MDEAPRNGSILTLIAPRTIILKTAPFGVVWQQAYFDFVLKSRAKDDVMFDCGLDVKARQRS